MNKILIFLAVFFVASSAQAGERVFNCTADSQCTIIDICAKAYAVNQSYASTAAKRLGLSGGVCLTVVPPEIFSHLPICINNKCSMRPMDDTGECSEKLAEKERNYCFNNHATKNQDISTCHQLSEGVENCEFKIFNLFQRDKGLTLNKCKLLRTNEYRDNCYDELAQQDKDVNSCFQIYDVEKQKKCLVNPQSRHNDQSYWANLSKENCDQARVRGHDNWSDRCLLEIEDNNTNKCEAIEEITLWYHCVRDVALKTDNLKICDQVSTRTFPSNYPKRAYSIEACKKWVSNGGRYIVN